MGYRPPKGVRPPQLEGKRTGRPRGLRDYAPEWAEVKWAYERRDADEVEPPSRTALLWWRLAALYPDELGDFLARYGRL